MASDTDTASSAPDEPILLAAKLDTAASQRLHAELTARFGADVALDGSAVEMLGGRCTDVMMAARALWGSAGQSFAITSPSEALLRDLAILGVTPDALAIGDAP